MPNNSGGRRWRADKITDPNTANGKLHRLPHAQNTTHFEHVLTCGDRASLLELARDSGARIDADTGNPELGGTPHVSMRSPTITASARVAPRASSAAAIDSALVSRKPGMRPQRFQFRNSIGESKILNQKSVSLDIKNSELTKTPQITEEISKMIIPKKTFETLNENFPIIINITKKLTQSFLYFVLYFLLLFHRLLPFYLLESYR